MSTTSSVKVNSIYALDPVGPVNLPFGVTIPSGQALTSNQGLSVTGVITASQFVGNGSQLTNISIATTSKVIAFSIIA